MQSEMNKGLETSMDSGGKDKDLLGQVLKKCSDKLEETQHWMVLQKSTEIKNQEIIRSLVQQDS